MRYPQAPADPAAREKRIESMMPMVKRIAWHVFGQVGRAVDIEDLIQAGMLGLVEAAQRGQHVPDDDFPVYASQRIRGSMIDLVRRQAQLSRITVDRKKLMRTTRKELEISLGRVPTPDEVATALGIDVRELAAWEEDNAARQIESLDELVDQYGMWFVDQGPHPDMHIEREQLVTRLHAALGRLDERLQMVLQLYYTEELNLREIAEILGLTIGRVSQLKTQAIQLVESALREESPSRV